jgi:F-type H+-transporting ATPase subunit b
LELNWSTFVLEIINFLILVWVLKRFFYEPVLDVIAKRRETIDKKIAEAQQLNKQAIELKREYKNRLSNWEKEKQRAKDILKQKLNSERTRQLKIIKKDLILEKEKNKNAIERRRIESIRQIEHEALKQSTKFASKFLASLSGPELEARLIKLTVNNLKKLDKNKKNSLKNRWGENPNTVAIDSAYPLTDVQKKQLEDTINEIAGKPITAAYSQNPDLLAGLLIKIDAMILKANVRDDLKAFAEFAYVARP